MQTRSLAVTGAAALAFTVALSSFSYSQTAMPSPAATPAVARPAGSQPQGPTLPLTPPRPPQVPPTGESRTTDPGKPDATTNPNAMRPQTQQPQPSTQRPVTAEPVADPSNPDATTNPDTSRQRNPQPTGTSGTVGTTGTAGNTGTSGTVVTSGAQNTTAGSPRTTTTGARRDKLPDTGSNQPLLMFFAVGAIAAACGLRLTRS